ncbi:hypothetical protein K466DRAFT_253433 [Polyporus arcularius HHB13444]|uniref:Uncharacterized protein n=1 Tax=Polyporus arcularius HHB13444 TaxID=1314778 RepID=A0A5C3PCT9_9APHY|nr:hypothetical protein K466DRAFT_253433 [Polyporus arcularius HHB13444]
MIPSSLIPPSVTHHSPPAARPGSTSSEIRPDSERPGRATCSIHPLWHTVRSILAVRRTRTRASKLHAG